MTFPRFIEKFAAPKLVFGAFFALGAALFAGTPLLPAETPELAFPQSSDVNAFFDFGENSAAQNPAAAEQTTSAALFANTESVPAGTEFALLVKIEIAHGWHIYWKNPGEAGIPLAIDWKNVPAGTAFGEWRWSVPEYFELQGLGGFVFENVAHIKIPVKIAADAPCGRTKIAGTASWLACDENGCFPQSAEISAEFEIVPAAAQGVPANAEIFAAAEKTFPHAANSAESAKIVRSAEFFVKNSAGTETQNSGGAALELRLLADADFLKKEQGALPRFFPENAQIAAQAGVRAPEISFPQNAENSALLVFELPLADTQISATEARAEAENSEKNPAAGILVFPDGNAFEISPKFVPANSASGGVPAEIFPDFALLAFAFLGGLILNLMPCVFPVLGLKILHFVGQAGENKAKIAAHGFVFALGVLVSFWILAAALAVLRSGGSTLGWGFQLQEPGFVYAMTVVLFVFGLSMSGVFEFGAGATRLGGNALAARAGLLGSFFSGVLAVAVATPCAAPFLAPALGSALALPAIPSFLLFTAIALGLAAPYVLFACVPALLKFLPKPGEWMQTFKQAMAFLLYAPALYFLWTLLGQVSDDAAQRDIAISFAAIAAACWIYGKWALPWRPRGVRVAGTLVALALFAGTLGFVFRTIYPAEKTEFAAAAETWIPWSAEAQARALDEGKIVYVDFTARWCATCQVNKRVYSDADLQEKFTAGGVVKMRADWTNKNPEIAAELLKYGRAAVPVNVFLKKGAEPVVLGELFAGAGTVTDGLAEIRSR